MFTRIIGRERENGRQGNGECGGEEKENGEGATSIAWTWFGKLAKKGRVEKEEEEEEEMMVMERGEEGKGYRLISSSHVRTRRPAAAEASSLRNAHARAWSLNSCVATRDFIRVWSVMPSGRRWLTDHH